MFDPDGRGPIRLALKGARKVAQKALFDNARRSAVRQAWKQEKELLMKTGRTTMKLSGKEKNELLKKGKVSGWEGHHINSVAQNDLKSASDPNNIKFVKGRSEHLKEHNGNFNNETSGSLTDRMTNLVDGGKLMVFFETYDETMSNFSKESDIISSEDSFWSYLNPFNSIVETAALLEAFIAAYNEEENNSE